MPNLKKRKNVKPRVKLRDSKAPKFQVIRGGMANLPICGGGVILSERHEQAISRLMNGDETCQVKSGGQLGQTETTKSAILDESETP